jgi:hypothetical protein
MQPAAYIHTYTHIFCDAAWHCSVHSREARKLDALDPARDVVREMWRYRFLVHSATAQCFIPVDTARMRERQLASAA